MKSIRYHLDLGATSTCTKRLVDEKKGLGQSALEWSTRDFFVLDSWF